MPYHLNNRRIYNKDLNTTEIDKVRGQIKDDCRRVKGFYFGPGYKDATQISLFNQN